MLRTGLNVPRNGPTDAQRGILNNALPTRAAWQPMVNTDIKLENVVLGNARADYYPSYKTLKMIDFGLAFNDDRYANMAAKKLPVTGAVQYRHIGTTGWRPPVSSSFPCLRWFSLTPLQEQFPPPATPALKQARIDTRADTWNIGMVMLSTSRQMYEMHARHTTNFVRT
jgi:serine/threonine protein kinase